MTLGCWADMYSQIIRKGFQHLRAGGWMESQEVMGTFVCDEHPLGPALQKWLDEVNTLSEEVNRPLSTAHELKQWYQDAGFVDVEEKVYRIPVNGWPLDPNLKRIGELWHSNMAAGLSGFSYALLSRMRGRSKEAIEVSFCHPRLEIHRCLFCVLAG